MGRMRLHKMQNTAHLLNIAIFSVEDIKNGKFVQ